MKEKMIKAERLQLVDSIGMKDEGRIKRPLIKGKKNIMK